MSEYMIDGTLLSNIAEGVRTVDGSTSKLTPAQMQARLTAIKSSVDAALSAVAGKNVTVPSGSDVHDLAGLIAAISGLPKGISAMTTGVYTPASNSRSGSLNHGLGVIPDFFYMHAFTRNSLYGYMIMSYASRNESCFCTTLNDSTSAEPVYGGTEPYSNFFTASNVTLTAPNLENSYMAYFGGGMKYYWIAGVWA